MEMESSRRNIKKGRKDRWKRIGRLVGKEKDTEGKDEEKHDIWPAGEIYRKRKFEKIRVGGEEREQKEQEEESRNRSRRKVEENGEGEGWNDRRRRTGRGQEQKETETRGEGGQIIASTKV